MPLDNDTLEPRPAYPVLDEGTYQVVIKDINKVIGSNYNTKEPETQYQFDLEVVEEGDDNGHVIKLWTSTAYSGARAGKQESKLYNLVTKAMKKVVPAEEVHLSELIGKQLKAVVTTYTNADGQERNKVVSFMESKTDVKTTDVKTVVEDKTSRMPENTTDQINIADIPF